VIADVEVLETLSARDFTAGLAESVKHAFISGEDFLTWHEARLEAIRSKAHDCVVELIARNCAIKAGVVAADEREEASRGVGRAALNFGHTIGHAVEALSGFQLRHGEAVSLGMVAAMELAVRCRGFADHARRRIEALLSGLGLPVSAPVRLDARAILNLIKGDKKSRGGAVRFVLPVRVGVLDWCSDPAESDVAAAINRIQ